MNPEGLQHSRMGPLNAGGRTSRRKAIGLVAVAVALLVLLPPAYLIALDYYDRPVVFTEGRHINPIGLQAEKFGNGDWLVMVMSGGGEKASELSIQVTNSSTGMVMLKAKLTLLNSTDGIFTDKNNNKKVDAGDTILLKDTAKLAPGMKVQLLKGESVLGTFKELPS